MKGAVTSKPCGDFLVRTGVQMQLDGTDAPVLDADIDQSRRVRQRRAANDEIHG